VDHDGCDGGSVVESRGRGEEMTQKDIHVRIVGANALRETGFRTIPSD
jgi:hypothetical protein